MPRGPGPPGPAAPPGCGMPPPPAAPPRRWCGRLRQAGTLRIPRRLAPLRQPSERRPAAGTRQPRGSRPPTAPAGALNWARKGQHALVPKKNPAHDGHYWLRRRWPLLQRTLRDMDFREIPLPGLLSLPLPLQQLRDGIAAPGEQQHLAAFAESQWQPDLLSSSCLAALQVALAQCCPVREQTCPRQELGHCSPMHVRADLLQDPRATQRNPHF
mmetsp:Transcript_82857/g.221396  ORF Transcript_82857/g.221396 Transcript_82857/m.221396 type:complete len:214 (-) Transcript_82857:686-1327(-)